MELEDRPAESAAGKPLGQALLFSREIELRIEAEEQRGRYTLERFRKLRPEAYARCVEELAQSKPGWEGLRRIAGIIGVHWMTVAGVRDEAGETIDTIRARISKKALGGVELLADRVLENPDLVPWSAIGLTMGKLTEIGELLGNRATSRSERLEPVDQYSDWEAFVAQFPSEKQLAAEDVREIGLGDGKIPTLDAAPASGSALTSDEQSLAQADPHEARPDPDTTNDTTQAQNAARSRPSDQARGGGGSSRSEGGASSPIRNDTQNFLDSGLSSSLS